MTTPAQPKLLLIDGHSMAYRAFFALPVDNFSTSTGQHTNAVYGFTSMLINLLRDEQPTHLAVAFDVSRHTFRTDEYADYKATRSKSPEEFTGQVALIREVLDALNIVHIELDQYEADDIIATLAGQSGPAVETLVVTGDRDALQLVNASTTVLYPRKGVSDLMRFTPASVEEKYGVVPGRYPELAALVGETSDNLPGVPGVGPKTAAKWIAQYDGLDNLLAHADEIKGKAGESLRAHLDEVRRNRRLNALVGRLELPVTMADLERRDWNREAVHTLFDSLEFKVLRDRLLETLPAEQAEPEGGFDIEGVVLAPGEVAAWLDAHASGLVGLVCDGTWRAGAGDLRGLALANAAGQAAYLDTATLTPSDDAALAAWLADPQRGKTMHDAKGPLEAVWARGWQLEGLVMDTQLAAYLLRPDQRVFDLADLSIRHLKRELAVASTGDQDDQDALFAPDDGPLPGTDAMIRARATVELAQALATELKNEGAERILLTIEMPLQRTLATMERTGIAVDETYLAELHARFDEQVQSAQEAAYAAIGKQINLGSPKQLQAVLFDELDMPKTRKTRTGYTTDADALVGLYAKTQHPFLEHLLRHRDQIRLRQTVEGLQKSVGDDGRIHTTYLQTVAATGRLSSTDPNLQNIPIRTSDGRLIRNAFVVGQGYESLMSADYSQIEMRIMAAASHDQALIEAFLSGHDFHSATAARVFAVDPAAVTPAQRAKVKAMNYGLAYGLSAFGLSGQLGISTAEARELMDEYFESFGHARAYLDGLVTAASKAGYTQTMLGRRRYLPDLTSTNRQRREMAERMALNAPIQGSAADIIKLAMLDVERALAEQGLASRMLLQVHDELVFEVAPGEREALEALVRERMGAAVELEVPLDVSIGVGRSWHDAAH